jgi:hypothetical protein
MAGELGRAWQWWESVPSTSSITQGDYLQDVLVEAKSAFNDLIVLTQACDCEKQTCSVITFCPIFPIQVWIEERVRREIYSRILNNNDSPIDERTIAGWLKELVREDKYLGMVPLNHVSHPEQLGYFVNLAEPVALARDHVDEWRAKQKDGNRLRLCPPYREYLAQAFARMYMRVACPIDVAAALPDADVTRYRDMFMDAIKQGREEIKTVIKAGKRARVDQDVLTQQKMAVARKHSGHTG